MSSKIRVCNVSERAFNWIKEKAYKDQKSQKVVIDELIDYFAGIPGNSPKNKEEKAEINPLTEIEKELKKMDDFAS